MSKTIIEAKVKPTQLTLEDAAMVDVDVRQSGREYLEVDPFTKNIESSEVVQHEQLSELQSVIRAAIAQHSMVLVSGPPGVGKTTGVRSVTEALPLNKYMVIYLGQDQIGGNLLNRFAEALGIKVRRLRSHTLMHLSQRLADNLKESGKSIVLIVDEAHLLEDQTLEDLRLLSNADYDKQSPFSLILISQPWLRGRLKSPFLEPLAQRIRYRYNLESLSKEDAVAYISSRLLRAGLLEAIFTADSLQQVFVLTEGIPRKINNLCSQLLLKLKAGKLDAIDAGLVKQVAEGQDI